ncbi:MAG TPA: Rrf2 family transcriptional regulator [Balneolales bacterium]|nr:Rrf2 family transcriptional regulator [Balneolales bacterium]
MQFLSQSAQYAISALIVLSREEQGKTVSAADLARPLHCPAAYLSQTLAKLIPAGIVDSRRGLNGGVYLVRKPEKITLLEVVDAIDGGDFWERCFLGIAGCGEIEPCPFHKVWKEQRMQINEWLGRTTFADINQSMTEVWFNLRLRFTKQGDVTGF